MDISDTILTVAKAGGWTLFGMTIAQSIFKIYKSLLPSTQKNGKQKSKFLSGKVVKQRRNVGKTPSYPTWRCSDVEIEAFTVEKFIRNQDNLEEVKINKLAMECQNNFTEFEMNHKTINKEVSDGLKEHEAIEAVEKDVVEKYDQVTLDELGDYIDSILYMPFDSNKDETEELDRDEVDKLKKLKIDSHDIHKSSQENYDIEDQDNIKVHKIELNGEMVNQEVNVEKDGIEDHEDVTIYQKEIQLGNENRVTLTSIKDNIENDITEELSYSSSLECQNVFDIEAECQDEVVNSKELEMEVYNEMDDVYETIDTLKKAVKIKVDGEEKKLPTIMETDADEKEQVNEDSLEQKLFNKNPGKKCKKVVVSLKQTERLQEVKESEKVPKPEESLVNKYLDNQHKRAEVGLKKLKIPGISLRKLNIPGVSLVTGNETVDLKKCNWEKNQEILIDNENENTNKENKARSSKIPSLLKKVSSKSISLENRNKRMKMIVSEKEPKKEINQKAAFPEKEVKKNNDKGTKETEKEIYSNENETNKGKIKRIVSNRMVKKTSSRKGFYKES